MKKENRNRNIENRVQSMKQGSAPYQQSQVSGQLLRRSRPIASYIALLIVLFVSVVVVTCGGPPGGRPGGRGGDSDINNEPEGANNGVDTAVEEELVLVDTFLANRTLFNPVLESSATVYGIREVRVISETSGQIQSVAVDLGQRVASGAVLIRLSDELERFAVAQAQDQLDAAEIELKATTTLFQSNNSSQAELSRVQSSVSGARSLLAQSQRSLQNRVIRTPIAGSVAILDRAISTGNYIQPGTVIATVVDLSRLQVDVLLSERDVFLVSTGDRAQLAITSCPDTINGFVRSIATGSQPSGSFVVRLEFANNCGVLVKSGMSGVVSISQDAEESQIVLPSSAILTDDEGQYVFLLTADGALEFAVRQNVTVGRVLGSRTEVLSGISDGNVIILTPLKDLEDGQMVRSNIIGN